MFLLKMFSRKWLLTTLLVVIGSAVCVRLGIWQLDRLTQRRAFNAQVESMRTMPPLDLNTDSSDPVDTMEWRSVTVTGKYDFENQIALRNQYYQSQYGYHLVTPLLFNDKAVLVDRGWIPYDSNSTPADWRKYDEPGQVTVTGQIRLEQTKPLLGGVADTLPTNGDKLKLWNNADIAQITSQLPYPALDIYIQPDMDASDVEPPIPFQPTLDLTEGPHMGYAIQWFGFATILFVGYPFYLRKQESK